MQAIDNVRKSFAQRFGSAAELAGGISDDRMHYMLAVLIEPAGSKAATEERAWKLAIEVVEWAASEIALLGEGAQIEVTVAFPIHVRATKRRVLRIGGAIQDLVALTSKPREAAAIAGTYHYRYEDWVKGLEFTP